MYQNDSIETAIAKFLEIVIEKLDGIPFKINGLTIKDKSDIQKGIDLILAIDGDLSVYNEDKHVWFRIYAWNAPDELIVDYTDNQLCNDIYNEFQNRLN